MNIFKKRPQQTVPPATLRDVPEILYKEMRCDQVIEPTISKIIADGRLSSEELFKIGFTGGVSYTIAKLAQIGGLSDKFLKSEFRSTLEEENL